MPNVDVVQLYGSLDSDVQDRAIAPAAAPANAKVVLATSIAETSLTIEGVRVVIDAGLSRVPRYEPAVGLTRLETVRVSRASADQRRGRAGRTEPGSATGCGRSPRRRALRRSQLRKFSRPISRVSCSISPYGASPIRRRSPGSIRRRRPRFPRRARCSSNWVRSTRRDASASAASGLHAFRLHPRLAAMIVEAAAEDEALLAAEVAAVVSERGLGGDGVDLSHRVGEFRRDRSRRAEEARRLARNWAARSRRQTAPKLHCRSGAATRARLSRPRGEGARRQARRIPACQWPRRDRSMPHRRWRASLILQSPKSPGSAERRPHSACRELDGKGT